MPIKNVLIGFLWLLGWATPLTAQRPELSVPGHNVFVNNIPAAQRRFPGVDGRGIVVCIKERQFQVGDVDLKGRVLLPVANALVDPTAHATIVATLIGGAGISGSQGQGVAPGCLLIPSGFDGTFFSDADTFYQNRGISVQNHAYGLDVQNEYTAAAKSYDASTVSNPSLVHVFSAGNMAGGAAPAGLYAGISGFANLTGSFKMAKNILVVGALDSFGRLQPFSSHGPTYDGRIKPDLCAYGHDGTSESAALVSGAAALVQQACRDRFGTVPESQVVRAILIGSARDILSPGPDYYSGWGRMDVLRALRMVEDGQIESGVVAAGDRFELPLWIPEKLRKAKITLCWNDETPQGQDTRTKALFSDLNLRIRAPDGRLHNPWRLNTAPHPDSLALPATLGRDTLNNVEQVLLDWPEPGLYSVSIDATAAKGATIPYAVAWDFDTINHFSWDYPGRGDPVLAGQEVLLQWDANLPDTTANVEWKLSGSKEWQKVSEPVSVAAGFLRWRVPDLYGAAQVRCCAHNCCYVSDTFLIAGTLRMAVGFNCPDSVYIRWNALAPDVTYRVLGLGERYLEPLFLTRDTFAVLEKKRFPQSHFAVYALDVASAIQSARSPAPDISNQGTGCYIRQFYSEKDADGQIVLALNLGTSYGLRQLIFERLEHGRFMALETIDHPKESSFLYTDGNVLPGTYQYRVVLKTSSGAVIHSDVLTVFVPGEAGWWVYPNPVGAGGALQLLSNMPGEMEFRLLDLMGREIKHQTMEDVREFLSLEGVSPGLYGWEIVQKGKRIGKGKLVVF